jgi:hypothetical protein
MQRANASGTEQQQQRVGDVPFTAGACGSLFTGGIPGVAHVCSVVVMEGVGSNVKVKLGMYFGVLARRSFPQRREGKLHHRH